MRVRDNAHWYLPGGKFEPGGAARAALRRKLGEELGLSIDPTHIEYLYPVEGPAYSKTRRVKLTCFAAESQAEPSAQQDITDVAWIARDTLSLMAPAVQILCRERL